MSKPPICIAATAMRNEGAFIVEWVTWYRMLGFDIIVATNDCTDRSPALLDHLADAGWVTHIPHVIPDGMPPQKAAHRLLHKQPQVRDADWVLSCDVDEFLVLHHADRIQDYLGPAPWDCLGIAFSWKNFGTSGWDHYHPGLVHRQFKRTGMPKMPTNRPFKSMHRRVEKFARLGAHTPHGYRGDWSAPNAAWVNGAGELLPEFADPDNHPIRFLQKPQINHAAAQMNHYVLRSVEHYNAKKGTLSASSFTDRYTDEFFERRNKNGMKDTTALRFGTRFDALHATAMALPNVARTHHLCCADYIARLCAGHGVDHTADSRWIAAMAAAG